MASESGLGSCTLWGLTPALNLLTFLDDKTLIEADDDEKAISILLFGQSDCRHVFKTLEEHLNFRTTKKIKINVYIVESTLEAYARQLLFLNLACQSPEKIGLYEKTRQFVELFGNTFLRPKTQSSLIRLSRSLVKMITDDDFLAKKLPFVSLSELKFVERDGLVEICKYWINYCDVRKEDIADKWDKRLRCHLGTRYDSRIRLFDWDYHMRLRDTEGAEIISAAEYKRWRGTGMAMADYEAEYSQPNVTLVSGAAMTTNVKNMRFLGEIITGPFIAFGIECDDRAKFEKSNSQYKHSSADIMVHNVEKLFLTISSNTQITPTKKTKGWGGGGSDGVNDNSSPSKDGRGDVKNTSSNNKFEEEDETLGSTFSVTFLPMESSRFLYLKQQYSRKFQLVYFSSTMAQNLTPQIAQLFAPEAVVIVEGVRHVLELRQEHIEAYDKKVEELAAAVNLRKHEDESDAFHRDYLSYTTTALSFSAPPPVPVPAPAPTPTPEQMPNLGSVSSKASLKEDIGDEELLEDKDTDKIQVIKKPGKIIAADGDYEDKDESGGSGGALEIAKPTIIEDVESDSASDPGIGEFLELQRQIMTGEGAGIPSAKSNPDTTASN